MRDKAAIRCLDNGVSEIVVNFGKQRDPTLRIVGEKGNDEQPADEYEGDDDEYEGDGDEYEEDDNEYADDVEMLQGL